MTITFDQQSGIFHLQTERTSYVMGLVNNQYLAHMYWGSKVRGTNAGSLLALKGRCSFSPSTDPLDGTVSLDTMPLEYPTYGTSDFRIPAMEILASNGTSASELVYQSHVIYVGKKPLDGLPATYTEDDSEADSVDIVMMDVELGLIVTLTFSVYTKLNAITRSVRIANGGGQVIKLNRALSMSVDMPGHEYDLLQLTGSWARERHIQKRKLTYGSVSIESRRGASSHSANPFVALMGKGADEDSGEVYGISLVYSGSFLAQAEVEPYGMTRLTMGINPFDFSWHLEPGESFQTPEAVMVYSDQGLGGMSRTYHKLYRTRLCRGEHRDRERPVLVNNWEATYFDFDADKIEAIAAAGQQLGIELFVLDDGWFGKRDSDKSSLGDWFVDRSKLPNGLEDLVARVNQLHMGFGLWFEPEMISPNSELYRKHPNWCLHIPGRRRTEARNQLVLDYSRGDVRDYIVEAITNILKSSPIAYVKWDMNRNMTEIGSVLLPPERQRETAHRYILGLYEVLERITTTFPNILFESCSGGGGRFDPGMLYYMPQTWTSDNSDAVERLKIQYGTSIVYPISTIGAHVSAIPNHQVKRNTSLEMRSHAAMSGNFGYELDLTKFTEEEKLAVKSQIILYKELRPLIQFGEFYRLRSPFEGNDTGWMFVSEDRSEAVVAYFQVLSEPNAPLKQVRLKGLNPALDYLVEDTVEPADQPLVFGGDELMGYGINLPPWRGDFLSKLYRLKAIGGAK